MSLIELKRAVDEALEKQKASEATKVILSGSNSPGMYPATQAELAEYRGEFIFHIDVDDGFGV